MAIGDDVFLPSFLIHKGTYWPIVDTDGLGQPVFGGIQEIDCRWDHVSELIVMPGGEVVSSSAKIMVDRDMNRGERLRFGDLDSVPNPNDPLDELNGETWEVKRWQKSSPPSDGTKWVRIASV